MAEQRTITLNMDATDQTEIAAITGQDKLNAAIGYLSGWNMSFGHVTISGGAFGGNPELLATYRTDADEISVGYVIGAVWQDDPSDPTSRNFGFNS